MTIRRVADSSVAEVFSLPLRIPSYQRPYSWSASTAMQLFDDLHEWFTRSVSGATPEGETPYVLGSVILHERHSADGLVYDLVDGQQRMLTLRILLTLLDTKASPETSSDAPPASGTSAPPIVHARSALRRAMTRHFGDDSADRKRFASAIRARCQIVQVVTDSEDEAFRIFDSQNYRGKPLSPHDLLKAHHLREMAHENDTVTQAVIEQWENASDSDLHRLFGLYLYRIKRWSAGERAGEFTAADVGSFKGITLADAHVPSLRYHLASQEALPLLNAWSDSGTLPQLTGEHSRFQLTEPLRAGRGFFEMTAFMLSEVERLLAEPVPGQAPQADQPPKTFAAWRKQPRYQKCVDLYIAAVLLYVNRFGEETRTEAEPALFVWAFQLRTRLLRVQHQSIELLATGATPGGQESQPSPFTLLRASFDGRAVHRLTPVVTQRAKEFEADLFAVLERMHG
ncbi:DUF262 domain-containing protein [Leucobacter chromiireducens]|uniref:DUF262 domain-containing protein n=1 Tax=Leucobacter chromiireducens TaxID=283877 RepID=UPI003F7FEFFB